MEPIKQGMAVQIELSALFFLLLLKKCVIHA